jgi:hypothetical protein
VSRKLLSLLIREEEEKRRGTSPGRGAEGSPRAVPSVKVSKVDVSSPPPPQTPKAYLPEEWREWGEEARYVFHERFGIGLELNMDEESAAKVARAEAILVERKVPSSLQELTRTALVLFGGDVVSVQGRKPGERIERGRA